MCQSESAVKIAIYGNRHQESHFGELNSFFQTLSTLPVEVRIENRFYNYLRDNGIDISEGSEAIERVGADTTMVVSIGGDGTFLRAAQWLDGKDIPVLGINTGTLGFLSNYNLQDGAHLMRELIEGKLEVEYRSVLKIESEHLPRHISPFALNEVAILKDETSSMINIHTEIDGYYLADYKADGLIIATPTGSTAYNLSVGGPILQPTLDCRVISPVAPHSLTMRPLVVDGASPIVAVTTSRAQNYRVSLDGRSFVMRCGSKIVIKSAAFKVAVAQRGDYNFASTLRQKLYWASR